MNRYPLWKYVLLVVVLLIGVVYALPNLYGEAPAVQISPNTQTSPIDDALIDTVRQVLTHASIPYQSITKNRANLLIRFRSVDAQIKARDALQFKFAKPSEEIDPYTVALNLVSATPKWLEMIGAHPMKLGLDLRGGVHLLIEVDIPGALDRRLQNLMKTMIHTLREEKIRYRALNLFQRTQLVLQFDDFALRDQAYRLIQRRFSELVPEKRDEQGHFEIVSTLTPAAMTEIRQYTLDQTMTTLRNRVNELGVAEAVVQQQGAQRIAVDLPGIQDAGHAKQILGGTATLGFYLVDTEHDPRLAVGGIPPMGTKLYQLEGQPVLLKTQLVLSGDAIVSARSGLDDNGMPAVHVSISGASENMFSKVTRENVGKALGIVYIETKTETRLINGKPTKVRHKIERLTSAPRIQTALGNNFQITGLNEKEARDLALLLRAGSLPAAIDIVEERTVGPSLGLDNIRRGVNSLVAGMLLVVVFMAAYYRMFGLIADLALLLNLVLVVAVLSLLDATLTLPGIAGMVLTVGMAVDSNVLIFERIREELRQGVSVQASIHAGYERAFATIVDANITTLIVAVVLFSVGTGAVKGFAVTLTIGLITSMITAITFTRAIVNACYGGRHLKRLSIGI